MTVGGTTDAAGDGAATVQITATLEVRLLVIIPRRCPGGCTLGGQRLPQTVHDDGRAQTVYVGAVAFLNVLDSGIGLATR